MKKAPTDRTLVLGCGNKPYGGALNVDIIAHSEHVDMALDLNKIPWPFKDAAFDFVIAESVLEHLDCDLLTAMNETWRVLECGGRLSVKLPYWNHEMTWNDPTHRRGYGVGIFDQFDPSTERGQEYDFYTPCKWAIAKVHVNPSGSSVLGVLRKLCRK